MFDHFSETELAILEARAKQIAADKSESEDLLTVSALRCRVGGEWYAIPLEELVAIYCEVTITPVPGAPAFVKGIANIRGRILSVLGLGELLNVPGSANNGGEVIVVSFDTNPVALLVDRVENVVTYAPADIEAVPDSFGTKETMYTLADGTLILHIEPLLSDTNLLVEV